MKDFITKGMSYYRLKPGILGVFSLACLMLSLKSQTQKRVKETREFFEKKKNLLKYHEKKNPLRGGFR